MSWDNAKDALLCAGSSLAIWLLTNMRSDFKDLTKAVTDLTVKIEAISSQSLANNETIKDHEIRLRVLEKSSDGS
jgi:hypothetical protein